MMDQYLISNIVSMYDYLFRYREPNISIKPDDAVRGIQNCSYRWRDLDHQPFVTVRDKGSKQLCGQLWILRDTVFFANQEELRVTRCGQELIQRWSSKSIAIKVQSEAVFSCGLGQLIIWFVCVGICCATK